MRTLSLILGIVFLWLGGFLAGTVYEKHTPDKQLDANREICVTWLYPEGETVCDWEQEKGYALSIRKPRNPNEAVKIYLSAQ